MKKTALFFIIILLQITSIHANWYGNHAVSFTPNPVAQNCLGDGDGRGGGHAIHGHRAVANNNSSVSIIPETTVFSRPETGNMRCLYWDASGATKTNITYVNGWTNASSHNVTVTLADVGGSGLHRVQIRRLVNTNSPMFTGAFTVESTLSFPISGNSDTVSRSYGLVDKRAYRYQYRVQDLAQSQQTPVEWSSWTTGSSTVMVDRDIPDAGDIVVNTLSGNFLARDSQNMRIDVDNENGSNIVRVQGFFERDDINNSVILRDSTNDNNPGNTSRLQFNWDMSQVDNDGSPNNGYRDYNFRITYIQDAAGNSIGTLNGNSSTVQTYGANGNYRVFANTLPVSLSGSVISENISNTSNRADGSIKNIRVKLEDEYGNKIIPVGIIGREINVGITADNYLRLNQYENIVSDSALFIGNINTEIPIGPGVSGTVNFTSNITGEYDIPLYVFAPTNNADSLVPGVATIIGAQVDIDRSVMIESGDDSNASLPILSPISIYADSLYKSNFTGDIVDVGFIDGASQNSEINIVGSGGNTRRLYLEFGGESGINMSNISLYATGSELIAGDTITENQDYASLFEDNIGFTGGDNIETLLEVQGVSPDLGEIYLASVVRYSLLGKDIVYPSGIINKPAYHNAGFNGLNNQLGIQILGNTSSQNTQEIIVNQFSDDIRVLGNLIKSTFRRDISQNVYSVIRNIDPKSSGTRAVSNLRLNAPTWNAGEFDASGTSRGESIVNEKILYFGEMGGSNIQLYGANNIEGNKTIVVEQGDVYIRGDILNPDNDGVLGIIVIDGDIFIDPTVTDINAILYTDRSIMSSTDGVNPIGATSVNILANQLYIKGSVFSENTLGGSRNIDSFGVSNPLCPYYIPSFNCNNYQDAQLYDLNYLRRYFIYDSDSDGIIEFNGDDNPAYGGDRSIGLGGAGNSSDRYPVIIDYNPAIQQTPPPFFD